MEILTSRDNTLIKNLRSLASDAKERREQGRVFLEGLRLCCEAGSAGVGLEVLLVTESALARWEPQLAPLLERAERSAVITQQLSGWVADTKSPQGVFAVCRMPERDPPDFAQGGRFLLLDRLQDPGNLGTILRCAEAFGVDGVLLSRDCADRWSPKVLRGTMGSCFRQPVWESDNLEETIGAMRRAGLAVYCAALDTAAVPPAGMTPGRKGIGVVVGNEGSGVSPRVRERCDGTVYIPMTPSIESLNAATAAAVLLWELSGKGKPEGQL